MPKTILIVDDDELSVKLFGDILTERGYNVIKTDTGRDVQMLARDNRPDLILMDIRLPEISGLDAFKLLRDDPGTKDIPVIAVTAFALKGDEEKYCEAGFDGYISKPILMPKYLDMIEKHLNGGVD